MQRLRMLRLAVLGVSLASAALAAETPALQQRLDSAAKGDKEAQFSLFLAYARGEGVPQDVGQALKWLRLAAGQGHANAQFNLGVAYERGLGVPKNDQEAVKWYRAAAEQGVAEAQFNLGIDVLPWHGSSSQRSGGCEVVPPGG